MTFRIMLIVTVAIFAIEGCAPRIDVRGTVPDADLLADIEIGHINKKQVVALIGSPSSTNSNSLLIFLSSIVSASSSQPIRSRNRQE